MCLIGIMFMKQIWIQRMIEDIDTVLRRGNHLLYEEQIDPSEVARYYSDVLKTLSFMLSQELK